MLITSRDTGRWVLPKGWPEGREQLADTALREAAEEAGVAGAIAASEIGRYFYGKKLPSGLERRCEVRGLPARGRCDGPPTGRRGRSASAAGSPPTKPHAWSASRISAN